MTAATFSESSSSEAKPLYSLAMLQSNASSPFRPPAPVAEASNPALGVSAGGGASRQEALEGEVRDLREQLSAAQRELAKAKSEPSEEGRDLGPCTQSLLQGVENERCATSLGAAPPSQGAGAAGEDDGAAGGGFGSPATGISCTTAAGHATTRGKDDLDGQRIGGAATGAPLQGEVGGRTAARPDAAGESTQEQAPLQLRGAEEARLQEWGAGAAAAAAAAAAARAACTEAETALLGAAGRRRTSTPTRWSRVYWPASLGLPAKGMHATPHKGVPGWAKSASSGLDRHGPFNTFSSVSGLRSLSTITE